METRSRKRSATSTSSLSNPSPSIVVPKSTKRSRPCHREKLKPAPKESYDSSALGRASGESGKSRKKGNGSRQNKRKRNGLEKEEEKQKGKEKEVIESFERIVFQREETSSQLHLTIQLGNILSELKVEGNEENQVEGLTQLSELLLIQTAESLKHFPMTSFVPVLVGLLNKEDNPNIMLLSARALTNLCDALPYFCAFLLQYGAVSCFTARLLTFEYIELAEQSLQGIKKISEQFPTECLRTGALMAVLSYLDFFSIGVQRVALSTATNMCKNIPSDATNIVMDAVPLLTNLLHHHDSKVLDHAAVCLTHIIEAFSSSPHKLDELCSHGLVEKIVEVISESNSRGGGSTPIYTGLICVLSLFASGSKLGAKILLFQEISTKIKNILSNSEQFSGISISPALTSPPNQILEIVNLADGLLAPLPKGIFSPREMLTTKCSIENKREVNISGNTEDTGSAFKNVILARMKLMGNHPKLLEKFGGFASGSDTGLEQLKRQIQWMTEICPELRSKPMEHFLASILAWKDPQILNPALQMAEILMEKLLETFSNMFTREGVYHAINLLILSDSSCTSTSVRHNESVTRNPQPRRSHRIRNKISEYQNMDAHPASSHPNSYAQGIVNPSTSTLLSSINSSNYWDVLSTHAKVFIDKYFPSSSREIESGLTDDFIHLKKLCMDLNVNIENVTSVDTEDHVDEIVFEILKELVKGVSTFEFTRSGVVSILLNYFSCGTFSKERVSDANFPNLREKAIRRFKSFIAATLLTYDNKQRNEFPLTLLIQKLQSALSSLEQFPIVLSHSRLSTENAHHSHGLGILSRRIKVHLSQACEDKSLLDYSKIIPFDPMITLSEIDGMLWPMVKPNDCRQKVTKSAEKSYCLSDHGYSTRFKSSLAMEVNNKNESQEEHSNLFKGKGKAVVRKTSKVEQKGTQTRIATHKKTVSSKISSAMEVNRKNESKEEDGNLSKGKGKAFFRTASENEQKWAQIRIAALGANRKNESKEGHSNLSKGKGKTVVTRTSKDEKKAGKISSECTKEHSSEVMRVHSNATLQDKIYNVTVGNSLEDYIAPSTSNNSTFLLSRPNNRNASRMDVDSDDIRTIDSFDSMGSIQFSDARAGHLGSSENQFFHHSGSLNESPKLIFSSGGKILDSHLTLYQAIQQKLIMSKDGGNSYKGTDLIDDDDNHLWGDWDRVYSITYQKADASHDHSKLKRYSSVSKYSVDKRWYQMSLLDSIIQGELPCDLEKTNNTYSILALLRILEGLNQLVSRLRFLMDSDVFATEGNLSNFDTESTICVKVPSEEFINNKLTPKLTCQLQDCFALSSRSLPSWCSQLTKACPFLFPFETRKHYFYFTTFGSHRAFYLLQQGADNNNILNKQKKHVVRLQRQKVRVSRDNILESCAKVMNIFSSKSTLLEVDYFDEVGSGLGPTLEFYTLLSHEFQMSALQMWRCNSSLDANGGFVQTNLGLFPRPWLANDDSIKFKIVVDYFHLFGQVIAKALLDRRLLDLPLSEAFYKLVLGQELDLHDILSFDPNFGKILLELQMLVVRKKYIDANLTSDMKVDVDLHFHGMSIEDLCFDFTLPGYSNYILDQGKENTMVNINNLEDYISLVVDATINSGIRKQVDAFRAGFNKVFDITSLEIFSPSELDCLVCGRRELWESETLIDNIKFDHGYTANSPAIANFLEVMGEFSLEEQRAFCQFVTGSPKLPPCGLAGLCPKLTIVRKISSSSSANLLPLDESAFSLLVDSDLPSVMTCTNYLKLPPYSTKEIMKKKLVYAIKEGQGSFDLS